MTYCTCSGGLRVSCFIEDFWVSFLAFLFVICQYRLLVSKRRLICTHMLTVEEIRKSIEELESDMKGETLKGEEE